MKESVVGNFVIVTTSHDIVGSVVVALFFYNIEVCNWASITRDICHKFRVFDCLHHFEKVLNEGIYEAIWSSRFK